MNKIRMKERAMLSSLVGCKEELKNCKELEADGSDYEEQQRTFNPDPDLQCNGSCYTCSPV